jgi:malate synthase
MEQQTETLTEQKLDILTVVEPRYESVLSEEALDFLYALHIRFQPRRKELLESRVRTQEKIDNGWKPAFLSETREIRESAWKIDPVPADLQDRRVEITGPVDRKMIINALNSGAKVFMADFEDSNSPSWENVIEGQINLQDAIRKTISLQLESGKTYQLGDNTATLMVRPRGWHLEEKHIRIEGESISASLFDFGLYFFHNARKLLESGSGPYFYLPKIEQYREAKLWNDVFVFSQNYLSIPQGTIKATVLVETILASFQLHEILFELRHHSAGMNCGRWDYIFSFIKKFRNVPGVVFPQRSDITMTVPFMRAYTQLVVKTCHVRGAHAIGGMAAQIPIKNDPQANAVALEKVVGDKTREVKDGHDGTWVAHPGLVAPVLEIFNQFMPGKNQIDAAKRQAFFCTADELLDIPKGRITEDGLRLNVNVGILYTESWLNGNGAAALYNMMEDAATAEISRSQLWQWIKTGAVLEDGRTIDATLYQSIKAEELEKIKILLGEKRYQSGKFEDAVSLFDDLVLNPAFQEFLTIPAYQQLS